MVALASKIKCVWKWSLENCFLKIYVLARASQLYAFGGKEDFVMDFLHFFFSTQCYSEDKL